MPLVVRKWDSQTNTAKPEDPETCRSQLSSFWDKNLSPYRQSARKDAEPRSEDWADLTSHITQKTLEHLTQSTELNVSSASSAKEDRDDIPLNVTGSALKEQELGVLGINMKKTW